ncbi:MAG: hypothetical protein K6E85_03730 [Lachnospiraceae bacterium]|nr:hypothetical protein [Lachnospiraceae bacterium]
MEKMKKVLFLMFAGLLIFALAPTTAKAATKAKYTYYGYSEDYGFVAKVTDPKGNEIKQGATVTEGTELTVTLILDEYHEWGTYKYVYTDDYYYPEGDSFTFTPHSDFWVSAYPNTKFAATVKTDKYVKSIEFINAETKTVTDASQKNYIFEKANGLSGNSIALKCIFEDGYELDEAVITETASDAMIIRNSENDIFEVYFDMTANPSTPTVVKITSKKAASRKLSGKPKTVKPTVKKNKGEYDNQIDYILTFGKGKKATTFSYSFFDYDTSEYSYFNSVSIGSDAKKYEVIDLSEATKVPEEILKMLVDRIYHFYRMDKFPALKAIYLPKGVCIPLTEKWYGEFTYYPIKVITMK